MHLFYLLPVIPLLGIVLIHITASIDGSRRDR
jgi:hypothetical protein